MKPILKILIIFLFLPGGATAQEKSFAAVAWLAGCWGGEMNEGRYEECWTAPLGDFMQGSGRLVKGNRVLMREHITIERESEGLFMYVLTYGPKIKADQKPVGFKLVKSAPSELVFENPAHDYPQRIIYRRDKQGDIAAYIEMLDGKRQVKFPMNSLSKKESKKE